jgi:hypothetical protein
MQDGSAYWRVQSFPDLHVHERVVHQRLRRYLFNRNIHDPFPMASTLADHVASGASHGSSLSIKQLINCIDAGKDLASE